MAGVSALSSYNGSYNWDEAFTCWIVQVVISFGTCACSSLITAQLINNENLDGYICKNVPSIHKLIGIYEGKEATLPALAVISHAMRLIQRYLKRCFSLVILSSFFIQLALLSLFMLRKELTINL